MVTLSVLGQLDIIATASGGAMHAVSDAVDPFVFRLSIFVLAVFVAAFSAALASNAPGGLGVFELLFLKAMPAAPQAEVLTALRC